MKITFLGGGNMAVALIGGLLKQGFAAEAMQVIELVPEARQRLSEQFGLRASATLDDQALDCDVLVLAVKPQQMRAALAPAAARLGSQLVLSIAAGLRIADLSRWLGGHPRIVRAMPNTPALIGAGASGLVAAAGVSAAEREAASRVLGAVGSVTWLEDEALLEGVTALSGSGPAYVFYFIEALIEGGIGVGLSAEQARALALDTVLGSAQLAASANEDAATLRARVTSKGGTTEAALQSLEHDAFKPIIARALAAAAARGQALGDLLGRD